MTDCQLNNLHPESLHRIRCMSNLELVTYAKKHVSLDSSALIQVLCERVFIEERRTKDLKDHEIAEMVNNLLLAAKTHGHAQSCREQLRKVVLDALEVNNGR